MQDAATRADTNYASATRTTPETIRQLAEFASANPVITTVLESVAGWVAILDGNRQIIAANRSFLDAVQAPSSSVIAGLRPGECIGCVHADDCPGGCGTAMFCRSCGAAQSIVECLATGKSCDHECVLTLRRHDTTVDADFLVRAAPFQLADEKLVLLFLRDISAEKSRAALESVFFHDIRNVITALVGTAELFDFEDADRYPSLARTIRDAAWRLEKEVQVQRLLLTGDSEHYAATTTDLRVADLVRDLAALLERHRAAKDRHLEMGPVSKALRLQSDPVLIERILINMVVNACEASQPGHTVRLTVTADDRTAIFSVWNPTAIPEEVMPRIFQRYFSTKAGHGRGLGTYSMKLLAERFLHGHVDFSSSPSDGTTFRLYLPLFAVHAPPAMLTPLLAPER